MKKFIESFLGSFGILIAGVVTIPLAAKLSGAPVISTSSAISMSIMFFVARLIYLYLLRLIFSRHKEGF